MTENYLTRLQAKYDSLYRDRRSKREQAIAEYAGELLETADEEGRAPGSLKDWALLAFYGVDDGELPCETSLETCIKASMYGNFLCYTEDLAERLLTKKQARKAEFNDAEFLLREQGRYVWMASERLPYCGRLVAREDWQYLRGGEWHEH